MSNKDLTTSMQAEKGGPSLTAFLNELFILSAGIKHTGSTGGHPFILLNSIKNLIGDNRKNPSIKLLKLAEETLKTFPRRLKDKSILNKTAKEGIGNTVFIMDLEDVCQSGNIHKMESEAAKLHWVSENSAAGLECLIEVALQDIDKNAAFAYHLQRAYVFQDNKEFSWTFTRSLLIELVKAPIPEPHIGKDISPTLLLDSILSTPDPDLWIRFAAVLRFWEGDFIRSKGYKREISHWLESLDKTAGPLNTALEMDLLEAYLLNGGPYFINLAEELSLKESGGRKIIALEALRYFSKKGTGRTLRFIAQAIKSLIES